MKVEQLSEVWACEVTVVRAGRLVIFGRGCADGKCD